MDEIDMELYFYIDETDVEWYVYNGCMNEVWTQGWIW